ncbi:MAG: hypothetical protein Q4P17_11015 [Methanobacterium sp.]|nr:hypothetical protein [Methanobacterium sp.]
MRISMTLPDELVNDLDEVLKKEGYQVRSEGIVEVLQEYVDHHKMG